MRVTLVGVSHHGAGVELRERVALRLEEATRVAAGLAAAAGEAVCLSTCNRTELYVAHDESTDAEAAATAVLLEREPELANALYRLRDEAAALHLFRVAAGLDSLVPGEGEILGQVRTAFEAGTTGAILDRLFRQALYAGRKARTDPRSASRRRPSPLPRRRLRSRSSATCADAGSCSSARAR